DQGTRLSLLFMSLMVFVIVLVLSLFEGFQKEVRSSLFGSGVHISVKSVGDGAPFREAESSIIPRIQKIRSASYVKSVFPAIGVTALLEAGGRFEGKQVRAVPVVGDVPGKGEVRHAPPLVHFDRDIMAGFEKNDVIIVGREAARYYGWQI